MNFYEWLFKTHKITKEMYENRSEMIKVAIKEEFEKYEEEQKHLKSFPDPVLELSNLEEKLIEKKNRLKEIEFDNYYYQELQELQAEIVDLEDKIYKKQCEVEVLNCYDILNECGVPFDSQGEPIGIG